MFYTIRFTVLCYILYCNIRPSSFSNDNNTTMVLSHPWWKATDIFRRHRGESFGILNFYEKDEKFYILCFVSL